MRLLKNANKNYSDIRQNPSYQFSKNYALSIYPLDAVYTFIPKNGCSTLRFSTAVANGFLSDLEDVNWIHLNNPTFNASQREISLAKYTFIVLRCPFRRLASCFLNKFVTEEIKLNTEDGKYIDANFSYFVNFVASQKRKMMNAHWRHQSDFLHYVSYDDYFSLEKFNVAIKKLKDKGFEVIDTRSALKHDTSSMQKKNGDYSSTPISELKKMRSEGYVPTDRALYTEKTYSIIQNVYKEDFELYKKHIGENNILKL